MQRRQAAILLGFLSLLCAPALFPGRVRAEQPRDWMVGPQPGGTLLNLDVVFPGIQAQLEHRVPIYGVVNELWLKANVLTALPFTESQFDVDLRLVVFSLGGSVGFRDNYRAMEFAPGERIDRTYRRSRELGGETNNVTNGFAEGRATLALPFNDSLVFLSINGLRYEGGPDRILDWRLGVVRDNGMYFNSNNTLFIKGRHWGGVGPQLQVLNFGFNGKRETQANYGFTFVTRPGLMRKNDIFFLSVLFHFDKEEAYGNHLFYAPMTFQLAYRMVFELQPKALPWEGDDK
jgi:hypothetical protein